MAEDNSKTMITTLDNPWNPWTNMNEWWLWDKIHGYNTPELMGRISPFIDSDVLSDQDVQDEIKYVQDEIIRLNPLGIYVKIHPNDKAPLKERKEA